MSKKIIAGVCSVPMVVAGLFKAINDGSADYPLRVREEFVRDYIGKFEGCRSRSYLDTGGLETVGIGSTHFNCGKIITGKIYSDEEIAKRLNKDLWVAEQCVNKYFNGEMLPQNKFEALVDFTFNLGCTKAIGAVKMTTIRRYALTGDYTKMCLEQMKWVKGRNLKGELVTIKGLYNRRKEVVQWCLMEN